MNAHILAKTAYSAPQTALRTPRRIEYDLFAKITARLSNAGREKHHFPALVSALHDNRRLWTALAADVSMTGNSLPEALRAQLFYLAEFTQVHSRKVLAGQDTVDALVEVNTAVMRGLAAQGDGG